MIKKVYWKERQLIPEICSCGSTTFWLWYLYDMLWSKCTSCGKESLQTLNKDYGTLEEDL